MFKHKFTHAFVPHKHNNYRPHAIRHKWLSIYSIGLILSHLAFGVAFYTGPINANEKLLTNNIIDLTNEVRNETDLGVLTENKKLTNAAYAKLTHMFQNNYWDHKGPDGTEAWVFIEENGYEYSCAGENLAKGFTNANAVFNAWMKSPTHRANILEERHRDLGIAVGTGELYGKNTTIIVQLFGTEKTYASEPSQPLTLGEKTSVPSISLRNATVPSRLPYFALWTLIIAFIAFDFIMLKREGTHKHKVHRLHFRSAIALSLVLFVILAASIASIA